MAPPCRLHYGVAVKPVNFSDFVAFVDQEARIATNPVFGDISDKTQSSSDFRLRRAPQTSPGFKPPKPKSSTFATRSCRAVEITILVLMLLPRTSNLVCAYSAKRTTP